MAEEKKRRTPKEKASVVWRESRDLLWARRGRLAIGFALLLISRLAGMDVGRGYHAVGLPRR